MNKRSSSNVNTNLIQSCLVFNNVLKILAKEKFFLKCFSKTLWQGFLKVMKKGETLYFMVT